MNAAPATSSSRRARAEVLRKSLAPGFRWRVRGAQGAAAAEPLELHQAPGALGQREQPLRLLEGAAGGAAAEDLVPQHRAGAQVDDGLEERDHLVAGR